MKVLTNVLFWAFAAIFVLPAIVGVVVGIAVVTLAAMLAFVVCLLALGVTCIACVPIVWWCASCDGTSVYACLSKLQVTTHHQKAEEN